MNGHVTSAHRDQLRLAYSKVTPRCSLLKHNRKRKCSEDDEPDFLGFPDETISNRSDNRLAANCPNHLLSGVRRSERLRIKNEKQIRLGDGSENVD